eukprot:gene6818-8457_t
MTSSSSTDNINETNTTGNENNNILLSGFIKILKKGSKRKKYWYTLDSDQNLISIFKNQTDLTPKSFVLTTDIRTIEKYDDFPGACNKRHGLLVVLDGDEIDHLIFITKTLEEREEFLSAIRSCMKKKEINGENITNMDNNNNNSNNSNNNKTNGRKNSSTNKQQQSLLIGSRPTQSTRGSFTSGSPTGHGHNPFLNVQLGSSRKSIKSQLSSSTDCTTSNHSEGSNSGGDSNRNSISSGSDHDDDSNSSEQKLAVEKYRDEKKRLEQEKILIQEQLSRKVRELEEKKNKIKSSDHNSSSDESTPTSNNDKNVNNNVTTTTNTNENKEEETSSNLEDSIENIDKYQEHINNLQQQKQQQDENKNKNNDVEEEDNGGGGDDEIDNMKTSTTTPKLPVKEIKLDKLKIKNNNNNFRNTTFNNNNSSYQFNRTPSNKIQNTGLSMDGNGYFLIQNPDQLRIVIGKSVAGESSFAGVLIGPFKLDWKPLSYIWSINSDEGNSIEIGPATPPKDELLKRLREKREKAILENDNILANLIKQREAILEKSEEETFIFKGGIVVGYRNDKWELLEAPISITSNNTSPYHQNNQFNQQQHQQQVQHQHQHQQQQQIPPQSPQHQPQQVHQQQKHHKQHSKQNSLSDSISNTYTFIGDLIQGKQTFNESELPPLPNPFEVEIMIHPIKNIVNELDDYFGHNTTYLEKRSLGDDGLYKKIANMIRGRLSTTIANVISHGFISTNLFRKRQYIWNFIESYRKMTSHESVAGISLIQAINTINQLEAQSPNDWKDPNVKFRTFICCGLNNHLLDQWISILHHNSNGISQYFQPNALITSKEHWDTFCQSLTPLVNYPFKLSLDYEIKRSNNNRNSNTQSPIINHNNNNSNPSTPTSLFGLSSNNVESIKSQFSIISNSFKDNTSQIFSELSENTSNITQSISTNFSNLTQSIFNNDNSNNIQQQSQQSQQPQQQVNNNTNHITSGGHRQSPSLNSSKVPTQSTTPRKTVTFRKSEKELEQQQQQDDSIVYKIQSSIKPISQKIGEFFEGY